jgi:hypothetical protein
LSGIRPRPRPLSRRRSSKKPPASIKKPSPVSPGNSASPPSSSLSLSCSFSISSSSPFFVAIHPRSPCAPLRGPARSSNLADHWPGTILHPLRPLQIRLLLLQHVDRLGDEVHPVFLRSCQQLGVTRTLGNSNLDGGQKGVGVSAYSLEFAFRWHFKSHREVR